MVENGTNAIFGAKSIVLQPAHFGTSSLAPEATEQSAHARLESA